MSSQPYHRHPGQGRACYCKYPQLPARPADHLEAEQAAPWHGVPRPEGLDEALSHARTQFVAGLAAEREHKQEMRDAGVDPADPGEREAYEAEQQAGLRSCAYCQVQGPAERFEPVNSLSVACRNARACVIRQRGGDPVAEWLTLTRALGAEMAYLDSDERATAALFGRQLGSTAGTWLSCMADSRDALLHVRAEQGCRTCGAVGNEPCLAHAGEQERIERPARLERREPHASHRPWSAG